MIVTKQRRSYQLTNNYNTAEKLAKGFAHQQNYTCNSRPSIETGIYSYQARQRHSISTVSPIAKNERNINESFSRKSQKKYDYSASFQRPGQKQRLNKTLNKIHDKNEYSILDKSSTKNMSFVLDGYQRRRYSSTGENIPKYQYTHDYKKQNTSQVLRPSKKANSTQKIQLKEYLKAQEPKYKSIQKPQSKTQLVSSYKQNLQNKLFFNKNPVEDNFGATDKFIQFKSQYKRQEFEETKNKQKYEPKYARMRNSKRCEIIDREKQNIKISANVTEENPDSEEKKINFQQLYRHSHIQNNKISDKISRISKLNEEISLKLQKMLQTKKAV